MQNETSWYQLLGKLVFNATWRCHLIRADSVLDVKLKCKVIGS